MNKIIVSADLPCAAVEEFERVVQTVLRNLGATVSKHSDDSSIVILACKKIEDVVPTPADPPVELPPPVDVPAEEPCSVEPPVPAEEPTIVPLDATPAEFAKNPEPEAPQPEVHIAEPEEEIAPVKMGEVVFKNLSTVCAVPFLIDGSVPCSELRVKELRVMGDIVLFEYCSMQFKFPVEKPSINTDVCNVNPSYTDTSIRVLPQLVGIDTHLMPILVKLTHAPEGSSCDVVFGSDVADTIVQAMEKGSANDSIPAE